MTNLQFASDESHRAYADLLGWLEAGMSFAEARAIAGNAETFYAAALRSHIAVEERHEALQDKRLHRLAMILERSLP